MKLSPETIALAYEIRCEYQWTYKRIANFIGCNENWLAKRVRERINAE